MNSSWSEEVCVTCAHCENCVFPLKYHWLFNIFSRLEKKKVNEYLGNRVAACLGSVLIPRQETWTTSKWVRIIDSSANKNVTQMNTSQKFQKFKFSACDHGHLLIYRGVYGVWWVVPVSSQRFLGQRIFLPQAEAHSIRTSTGQKHWIVIGRRSEGIALSLSLSFSLSCGQIEMRPPKKTRLISFQRISTASKKITDPLKIVSGERDSLSLFL